MTLLMRDNENLELGKMEKTVFSIRKVDENNICTASLLLGVSEDFIYEAKELIEKNPNADDKEIAEMLI